MYEVIVSTVNNRVLMIGAQNEILRNAISGIETKYVIQVLPSDLEVYTKTFNGTTVGDFVHTRSLRERVDNAWSIIVASATEFEESQFAQWEAGARLSNNDINMRRVRATYLWRISIFAGGHHLLNNANTTLNEANAASLESYITDLNIDIVTTTFDWYRNFTDLTLWELYLNRGEIWNTNPTTLAPLNRIIPSYNFPSSFNYISEILT